MCIFFPSSGGIQVLDSGFLNGGTQPHTQASSRYPSYQRRLGTENEIAETDWERDWVGLAFRVPQAKIFRTPDSRKEEFPRFRNSLTKGYMDNSIKCGGFWRLKSVKGTYNVVTERRTKKTEEKKTTDAQSGQQGKKNLNHTFIFDQLTFVFHQC